MYALGEKGSGTKSTLHRLTPSSPADTTQINCLSDWHLGSDARGSD